MNIYKNKYLKYKKKYLKLKGGSTEIIENTEIINRKILFDTEYTKCTEILTKYYNNNNYKYKKYIKDSFFDNFKKQDFNLLNWYKNYNPGFSSMYSVNPIIPEYIIIIVNIIKDYYIAFTTFNYPDNVIIDKTIYETILKKNLEYINTNIHNEPNINYNISFTIIDEYIKFFNQEKCDEHIQFLKSPYILFPSFVQLNFYKINLTIGAPVINYLLSNTTHIVHNRIVKPCFEIYHDIIYHYGNINITHISKLYNVNILSPESLFTKIHENSEIFSHFFNNINKSIEEIKDLFIYPDDINLKSDDIDKYMKSLIIFNLFHEKSYNSNIFNNFLDISLDSFFIFKKTLIDIDTKFNEKNIENKINSIIENVKTEDIFFDLKAIIDVFLTLLKYKFQKLYFFFNILIEKRNSFLDDQEKSNILNSRQEIKEDIITFSSLYIKNAKELNERITKINSHDTTVI